MGHENGVVKDNTVTAEVLELKDSGVGKAQAETMHIKDAGVGAAAAETMHITNAGIGAAAAETMHLKDSSIGFAAAGMIQGENVRVLLTVQAALVLGVSTAVVLFLLKRLFKK
jgi:hypothetical protein